MLPNRPLQENLPFKQKQPQPLFHKAISQYCEYYKIRTVFTTRADFFTLYKLKEIAAAIADGFSISPVFSALAGWKIHKGYKLPPMHHLLEMLLGLPLLHDDRAFRLPPVPLEADARKSGLPAA